MKKTVLILLLGFSVIYSFGQSKSDSIQVIHRLSTGFQQNGKTLMPRHLSHIIQSNSEAAPEMKMAMSNWNSSLIFQISGGFLIGYTFGTASTGDKANWTLAAIGAGLVLVAIPLVTSYSKHARKAVAIYNKGLKYSSLNQPNIRLGITYNGIGMRVSF